jgi:hypothetical protein
MKQLSSIHLLTIFTVTFTALGVQGHIAAWHKGAFHCFSCLRFSNGLPGMYCLNGTTGQDNQNTNEAVNPLYQVSSQIFNSLQVHIAVFSSSSHFKTGGFIM